MAIAFPVHMLTLFSFSFFFFFGGGGGGGWEEKAARSVLVYILVRKTHTLLNQNDCYHTETRSKTLDTKTRMTASVLKQDPGHEKQKQKNIAHPKTDN